MAKLKVEINTINSATTTLKNVSKELEDIIQEYSSIVNMLSSTWDGAASDEFIKRLKSQVRELKNVKKSVDGIRDYSGDVADTMKRIDNILTKALSGFMVV